MPETEAATRPRISVVIPHYNDEPALAADLAALEAQRGDGVSFEVIVVDNGSARLPVAVCDRFPAVRLLSETTPGPGPARNRGAGEARGEILAFVDFDCCPIPAGSGDRPRLRRPRHRDHRRRRCIAPADPARTTVVEAYECVFSYRIRLYIERDSYTGTGNMALRRGDSSPRSGPSPASASPRTWTGAARATALGFRHTYVPEMRVRTPARPRLRRLARNWDRHIAHFYAETRARPARRPRRSCAGSPGPLMVAASPLGEVLHRRPFRPGGPRLGDRGRALAGVHPAPAPTAPGPHAQPRPRRRSRPPAPRRLAGHLLIPVHTFFVSVCGMRVATFARDSPGMTPPTGACIPASCAHRKIGVPAMPRTS